MKNNQAILEAYVQDQKLSGSEPDKTAMEAILRNIILREGQSNEDQEIRSTTITEDTDGKVAAKQFSFYNLLEVKFYDLFGLTLDAIPIMGMNGKPMMQIAYVLLRLMYSFGPKLTYDFNETDARILLSIYGLNKKEVSTTEVQSYFENYFNEEIELDRLNRALGFFHKKQMIHYKGNDRYFVRESMSYERA